MPPFFPCVPMADKPFQFFFLLIPGMKLEPYLPITALPLDLIWCMEWRLYSLLYFMGLLRQQLGGRSWCPCWIIPRGKILIICRHFADSCLSELNHICILAMIRWWKHKLQTVNQLGLLFQLFLNQFLSKSLNTKNIQVVFKQLQCFIPICYIRVSNLEMFITKTLV